MGIGSKLIFWRSVCRLGTEKGKLAAFNKIQSRLKSTTETKDEAKYATIAEDYEAVMLEKETEIEMKRDKSRLKPHHRNMIHGRMPYDEPMAEGHLTIKYKRKMFGTYGRQSNIDPGTLWPNKDDIKETLEYENVAYPLTFQQMVAKQREIKEEEKREIQERQQKIIENLNKIETWKREIAARAEKKLADLAKAKAKKEALIEEVRKHFGYKIDEKDEKFQEMLVQKEKEQKRKLKEERTKQKQERLIADLMKKSSKA